MCAQYSQSILLKSFVTFVVEILVIIHKTSPHFRNKKVPALLLKTD